MEERKFVPTWRIVVSAILDFITSFAVFGTVIAWLTGNLTESGFSLNGLPALVCFVLIGLYFWSFPKYFGGRIWQRLLKAVR